MPQQDKKKPEKTQKPATAAKTKLGRKRSEGALLDENFDSDFLSLFMFRQTHERVRLESKDRKYLRHVTKLMLASGYQPEEISQTTGVPLRTVYFWQSKMSDEEKRMAEELLVRAVGNSMSSFLTSSLRGLGKIAQYCSSREYLEKHSPGDVSKLVENIGGLSMRLIEAQQRAEIAKLQARRGYAPAGELTTGDDETSLDTVEAVEEQPAAETNGQAVPKENQDA